jgi:hypothetical protein
MIQFSYLKFIHILDSAINHNKLDWFLLISNLLEISATIFYRYKEIHVYVFAKLYLMFIMINCLHKSTLSNIQTWCKVWSLKIALRFINSIFVMYQCM